MRTERSGGREAGDSFTSVPLGRDVEAMLEAVTSGQRSRGSQEPVQWVWP